MIGSEFNAFVMPQKFSKIYECLVICFKVFCKYIYQALQLFLLYVCQLHIYFEVKEYTYGGPIFQSSGNKSPYYLTTLSDLTSIIILDISNTLVIDFAVHNYLLP